MATFALVIVLLFSIGIYAMRKLRKRALDMASLISTGENVTGRVVMARQVRKSRTHKACRVRYAFVARDGIEYEREIEVRPNEFDQYHEGQSIDVVYDPRKPDINMLASAVNDARDARNTQHAPR